MKYVLATCEYCNNKWKIIDANDRQCEKCGDVNPKLEEKDTRTNIDYYQGSPPFPEEGITDGSNTRDGSKQTWYWDKVTKVKVF
jgi:hypothetical protein